MKLKRIAFSLMLCAGMLFTGVSQVNAEIKNLVTDHGTLTGMTTMYVLPGSPAAKGVDVVTRFTNTVSYIGYSLSLKANSTGRHLWANSRSLRNTNSIGDSFDFDKNSDVYKVTTAAFGSHEVRGAYAYVLYTSSVC